MTDKDEKDAAASFESGGVCISAAVSPALRYDHPVALIGGGDAASDDIADAAARSGAIIAADGGANRMCPAKGGLDAVIGDMDSVSDIAGWRARPDCRVIELAEQDSTDLEKCLYSVAAPLYLGVGFVGLRLDHTLAALNLLAKYPDKRVLLIGPEDVCFLAPLSLRLELRVGARVSIFPLPEVRAIASSGLRWPLDGLTFAIGAAVGSSNEASARFVDASFESQSAAILLERRDLDAAIACLQCL